MWTLKRFCCCAEGSLKWGALVIGIVEGIFSLMGILAFAASKHVGFLEYVLLGICGIHLISCIVLIISIRVQRMELPITYLITGILNMINVIVYSTAKAVNQPAMSIGLIVIPLLIYFWICVLSWFIELKEAA